MQTSKTKSKGMGMWPTIVLAVLLIASLAFLGWYWMQAEAEKKSLTDQKTSLQSQLDALKAQQQSSNEELTPSENAKVCNNTPTASLKENIKAALDSKNTAVFATYTSNPVTFVIAASEKGGAETPDQAAVDMDYANGATGPWDFGLAQATIDSYKAGFYKDYFGTNTYVGKAASGRVVSFDFDCNGKIKTIFLAADASLLL